MRRLTRGRAATAEEVSPPESGTSDAVGAAPSPTTPAATGEDAREGEAVTIVAPPEEAADAGTTEAGGNAADRDLPAGLDPGELAAAPGGSARRARIRRRLGYLRHARELLLRDLGGFYYEAHRSEGGAAAHVRLLEVKARRLLVLDAEVRELEERLGEDHPPAVIREPGIGGTCPHCGELHGSDARFCPRCGSPLTRGAARRHEAAAPGHIPAAEEQGRPTTASLWGRRRTPAPPDPTQADPQGGEAGSDEAKRGEAGRGEEKGAGEPKAGEAAPSEPKGDAVAAEERRT